MSTPRIIRWAEDTLRSLSRRFEDAADRVAAHRRYHHPEPLSDDPLTRALQEESERFTRDYLVRRTAYPWKALVPRQKWPEGMGRTRPADPFVVYTTADVADEWGMEPFHHEKGETLEGNQAP